MKQRSFLVAKISATVLVFVCLVSFSNGGGDYYKVLLNGRLIAEQYLTKPVAMKTLSLSTANQNDQLTVYYSHCGQAGKGRAISLKNENGKTLKEWKFADSPSQSMQISVGEVLNASSKLNTVSVYYSSKEILSGKQLITVSTANIAMAKR